MKIINASVRSIVILLIISLSFIGSNCNDILETVTNTCTGNQVDLIGSWKFSQNLGGIRDICLGEIVKFNSDGTANLTCPNQNTITKHYSVANNVLTYTETNIQYCISGNANELQLNGINNNGINNNRILYYVRVITDNNSKSEKTGQTSYSSNNSSEKTR